MARQLTEKYKLEAEQANLKWIKRSKNKDLSEYEYKCGCIYSLQMSNVRAKLSAGKIFDAQCNNCLSRSRSDKLEILLENSGAKLVGNTGNRRTRLVKLKCGHEVDVHVRNIQQLEQNPRKKIKCKKCLFEKYTKLGNKKGLKPIRHMNKNECESSGLQYGDYWLWEYISCGHRRPYQPSVVINGDVHCKVCIEDRHAKRIKKKGLVCLGYPIDPKYDVSYRLYKKIDCGHEFHIARMEAENGNFRCDECLNLKWAEEASRCGWTFLTKGDKKGSGVYRHDLCGQTEKRQRSEFAQASERINCRNCQQTSWSELSYVYLFKIKDGSHEWLKLGHSHNPSMRLKQYGLNKDASCKLVIKRKFDNRELAHTFEKDLSKKYYKFKKEAEVYGKLHSKSGKTECFDCTIQSDLTRAISLAKIL